MIAAVETHTDASPKLVHLFETEEEARSWFAESGLVLAWITPVVEEIVLCPGLGRVKNVPL